MIINLHWKLYRYLLRLNKITYQNNHLENDIIKLKTAHAVYVRSHLIVVTFGTLSNLSSRSIICVWNGFEPRRIYTAQHGRLKSTCDLPLTFTDIQHVFPIARVPEISCAVYATAFQLKYVHIFMRVCMNYCLRLTVLRTVLSESHHRLYTVIVFVFAV